MSRVEESHLKVIKFVQELLLDDDQKFLITPELIAQKIDLVLTIRPQWGEGLDRKVVTDELIRRFSMWVGQDTTIKNEANHIPWLNAARKKDWRYWQRYREWLETRLSPLAVDALDISTDLVLGLLEDPRREGTWDRRGLVVGHVQSGKTGNYTGLICKAADAGYKIIIVLAGLHNNLRAQTQIRLDEGFLGFETPANPDSIKYTGVGRDGIDASIRPNCATNRTEKGDFNTRVAKHLAITPEQRPWLFVVKKNKTVLKRLYEWIKNHAADSQDQSTGRKMVTRLPLLVIDDEADHASVDTGEQVFDETGKPDDEHEPTAINSLIRKILHSFSRSAYVGYTATPFANIFIHERGETRDEGRDLFPAAFIINLAAHSNYIGPARVFGLPSSEGRRNNLPLVRMINDRNGKDSRDGWMPEGHKNGHRPLYEGRDELPPSLIEAIDGFVLACALRVLRGQGRDHSSMLIHVTRFNSVQKEVHRQVKKHVTHMRQRVHRQIDQREILERLYTLWEKDFIPTTTSIQQEYPDLVNSQSVTWDQVTGIIPDVLEDIDVRMINGTAKDALDYAENQGHGLKVIAIGGDKLSRGLTLEGLCVSYFLRASRMYDTLMQMGRWFGYRPGYLDLSRLYTTSELVEWFGHITDAAEELREEFDLMAASGGTPRDYGLKVQSHPVLMVTSQVKMRTAKNLMISFSGQLLETVTFHRNVEILRGNFAALENLLASQGNPDEENPRRKRSGGWHEWKGYLWENVPSTEVISFLLAYKTHPASYKVNSQLIAEFIASMNRAGELVQWTIALIGGGSGAEQKLSTGLTVNMVKRKAERIDVDPYSIGRLLSPRDESIDFDEHAWNAALKITQTVWKPDAGRGELEEANNIPKIPNGPSIRRVRGFGAEGVAAHPEQGLLLLYLIDPNLSDSLEAQSGFQPGTPPVAAFGISFPGSNTDLKIEYKVNNVLWEQEYGPSE